MMVLPQSALHSFVDGPPFTIQRLSEVNVSQNPTFEKISVDGATDLEIKKAYRRLSIQYHPDKNPDPESHNYFVEYISKAYQALTDPVSRENFEKYGHPDGRQVSPYLRVGGKSWEFNSFRDVNGAKRLADVDAIFDEAGDSPILVVERRDERPAQPVTMNAFELISKSQGLNLSSLFEKQMGLVKRETRFTSKCPANEIISKIEEAATPLGFDVKKNNYKLKLQGEKTGRKGHLSVATEIFEVAPSLHMVEVRKAGGDTLEFHKFYKNLSTGLKDIVWRNGDDANGDLNG